MEVAEDLSSSRFSLISTGIVWQEILEKSQTSYSSGSFHYPIKLGVVNLQRSHYQNQYKSLDFVDFFYFEHFRGFHFCLFLCFHFCLYLCFHFHFYFDFCFSVDCSAISGALPWVGKPEAEGSAPFPVNVRSCVCCHCGSYHFVDYHSVDYHCHSYHSAGYRYACCRFDWRSAHYHFRFGFANRSTVSLLYSTRSEARGSKSC
mmetsp:Transcript_24711/g.38826  ORF Transcript_24711/g.38826 Transcript_24711/m.38826 type:complete len:203 (-) Transcript_24711:1873-2481(-)